MRDAETDVELAGGSFRVPANTSAEIGRIRVCSGEHKLFLIRWRIKGAEYGNHYLAGFPPIDLDWYRKLLPVIASLPPAFDAATVAR